MASDAERYLRGLAVDRLRELMPGARIIHELNVGLGQCRVDLAAITAERTAFVEIKSRKDKLDRLTEQVRVCRPAAHYMAVCYASERWTYSQVSGLARGCQIWPEDSPRSWTFWERYEPIDSGAMLNLLWAEELRAEAERAGLQPSRRESRSPLMQRLWLSLTGQQLVEAVCRQLRGREFAEADPVITA